jgi:phospholipase C
MSANPAIDTYVVLALENRSFDHMLGFLKSPSYPIDGLNGTETNPVDPHVSPQQPVTVNQNAKYYGDLADPGHSLNPAVIRQLYGLSDAEIQQLTAYPATTPLNNGFVYDYSLQTAGKDEPPVVASNIMNCFAPAKLPALAGLAQEFAICDQWYASIPGPTLPNRWYLHCATSGGYLGGSLQLTALTTIQWLMSINNRSWKIYYGDIPHALTLTRLWSSRSNFVNFDQFAKDAAAGALPNYSFIEPRYFLFANDQHPPHDVARGEALIATIYNALRSSPQWNRCMFIVTYDEHGGLYDHVPPPPATDPDGLTGYDDSGNVWLPFHCDRFGVRVPAIVVSPYVPKKTIASTLYDHTSIARTIEERFNLPALTARDAAANSLGSIASLTEPRTDAPQKITPPKQLSEVAEGDVPLSDLQQQLLELARLLPAPEPMLASFADAAAASDSEAAAGAYVSAKMASWVTS